MELVRESGGILWNMVPASRWTLTRHLSVGGVELRVMIESVGQLEYVVEMVRICVRAMWPRYPGQGLDPDPKEPRIHETTRVRTWSRGSEP
jgi:hypothetical protein